MSVSGPSFVLRFSFSCPSAGVSCPSHVPLLLFGVFLLSFSPFACPSAGASCPSPAFLSAITCRPLVSFLTSSQSQLSLSWRSPVPHAPCSCLVILPRQLSSPCPLRVQLLSLSCLCFVLLPILVALLLSFVCPSLGLLLSISDHSPDPTYHSSRFLLSLSCASPRCQLSSSRPFLILLLPFSHPSLVVLLSLPCPSLVFRLSLPCRTLVLLLSFSRSSPGVSCPPLAFL